MPKIDENKNSFLDKILISADLKWSFRVPAASVDIKLPPIMAIFDIYLSFTYYLILLTSEKSQIPKIPFLSSPNSHSHFQTPEAKSTLS